ncbi:MAG: MFS transporter, partial [Candidatus Thalassarchaeaceae archaeon]|nr:MFS transporter [Candidatus Thalassarchaeaceae archaeon]
DRILAAMRTRTAWIVLALCFLIPLGDGFEGMFAFYMRDVLGFDAAEVLQWLNIFIFATYLGLFGPWLSDYYGRAKVLRWSAMGSVACYAVLGIMMLIGAPEIAILVLFMPTVTVTDWLIFTFITTWAEVSDPRLGPTHMALYQTTQAVAATFIWFGLGVFLIYATGGAYWLIFLLACLGPMIGLSQFHKLKLGDDYGEDTLDIREEISKVQTKLAGMPWGVEPVDKSSRRRLAIGTAMAGLIISVALFTGPFVLLKWESEESEENWDLLGWNDTSITFETLANIGVGGNVAANIQVPTTQGGVYAGIFSVSLEGNQCALGPPSWTTTFSMPDRGNFSDGTNESNFIADDWEGDMQIDFDTIAPNLTGYSSEEKLRIELDQVVGEIWWGHGRGSWDLKVEMTGNSCLNAFGQANFRVNITAYHLLLPSTDPDSGMVEVSTSTTVTEHDYGEAVGVLLGFPILIATPFLAWIGGRDPETMLS